ncbi:MAG TPA: AfsA-related hotdog domain-containing protein [Solirubrobacterales bacterium]
MTAGVDTAAEDRELRLSREATVPRGLVHVRALSEVFIADHRQLDPESYATALQITRSHQLWGDRLVPFHDPVITLEVGRQSVFLVVHNYLEIPGNWKFVLNRIDFRVTDLEAYRDDYRVPPEGTARVRLLHRRDRHGLFEGGFEGEARIGERRAMEMSAEITVLSPYNYKLVRAYGRGSKPLESAPGPPGPERLPTAAVGRSNPRNVVLHERVEEGEREGELRFGLLIDEGHPGFFDHPHDHVTGSLILEFFRQAAIVAAHRLEALSPADVVVTACSMRFKEFAELDALTSCAARIADSALGRATVDLELLQAGARIAWATLELTEVEGRGEALAG